MTEDIETFAHQLADASGAIILPHFRQPVPIDNKARAEGGFDPVTAADRAAEAALRALIGEHFPDHGIIGEEFGVEHAEREHCWVLDPIDGTRAFIIGLPLWGTLIGHTRAREPVFGMMDQPFMQERWWGGRDAAFYRGPGGKRPIHTRSGVALDEAVLAATTPDMFEAEIERERFGALSRAVRLTRFGGDCYNYCLLAMGFIDLVVEASLKPFDIVALIPIIEAAGGRVSTWDGGDPAAGGRIIAAGDPHLHDLALAHLNP